MTQPGVPSQRCAGPLAGALACLGLAAAAHIDAPALRAQAGPGQIAVPAQQLTTDFGGYDAATAVVPLPDGRFVVGGYTGSGILDDPYASHDFALGRYLPNGQLDPTFGVGGRVITRLASGQQAIWDLALQPDGRLIAVGGDFVHGGQVARYLADGRLDPSFGQAGVTAVGTHRTSYEVTALQADGRVLVAGTSRQAEALVTRLTAHGKVDAAFGAGGLVTMPLGAQAQVRDLTVAADGSILVVGAAAQTASSPWRAWIARLDRTGRPVGPFGPGGMAWIEVPGRGGAYAEAARLLPDGRILVGIRADGPSSGADMLACRLTAGGSPDTAYGSDGCLAGGPGGQAVDFLEDLVLRRDGSGVLLGNRLDTVPPGGPTGILLALRGVDGAADGRLGLGGEALIEPADAALIERIEAAAPLPDDRLVMVGGQRPRVRTVPEASDFTITLVQLPPAGPPLPRATTLYLPLGFRLGEPTVP